MARLLAFLYGLIVYVLFLATIAYTVVALGYYVMPKKNGIHERIYKPYDYNGYTYMVRAVDAQAGGGAYDALYVNLGLMAAVIVAVPLFSAVFKRILPASIAQSTTVLGVCAVLAAVFWFWKPIPELVWDFTESRNERMALQVTFGVGLGLVVLSGLCIGHFGISGLRQALQDPKDADEPAEKSGFQRFMRHPMMLGMLLVLLATPGMSLSHMLFGVVMSVFVLLFWACTSRKPAKAS